MSCGLDLLFHLIYLLFLFVELLRKIQHLYLFVLYVCARFENGFYNTKKQKTEVDGSYSVKKEQE